MPLTWGEITRRRQPTSAAAAYQYSPLSVDLQRKAGVARQARKVIVVGERNVRTLELGLDSHQAS